MKIIYSISKVCSFIFMLITLSAVLTFALVKPKKANVTVQTNVAIGEYTVDIQSANNQNTYYIYIKGQKTSKYAISVGYYLYDFVQSSLILILEDDFYIYQVIISQEENASVISTSK